VAQGNNSGGDQQSSSFAVAAPQLALPKGGGAIHGIGEKFAANPVTGTGSLTVPIAVSPGRAGFGPQLTLSYDSGAGNGPFGMGWSLSLPSITRKTDKGLPQYDDDAESDVFVLSGAEDLVPVLVADPKGDWSQLQPAKRDGYTVTQYRPRIEGLFSRIERWTRASDGDTYWRSISKDNVTTFYGKTTESRIADPADPSRIFSWLICQSHDDRGNVILYKYVGEDSANIDPTQANERNRTRSANRYLKRILYGNRTSPLVQPDVENLKWLFELVFDYGEGHYQAELPDAQGREFVKASIGHDELGPVRQDPFSHYRSGFEVRAYRLCRRVLMFHHFEELQPPDYLVRSTEFTYRETPIASFITGVTQSGFVFESDRKYYLKRSLPPLEFEYSPAEVQHEVQEVDPDSLANLPGGVDGLRAQWLDLDGEGLRCILAEQGDGWYYKRNLSPLSFDFTNGEPQISARFEPLSEITRLPAFAEARAPRHQFLDLAGDGQLDCVVLERPVAGFYKRTEDEDWESFVPLPSAPNLDWNDPNLRFVDVDGDGHADVLITESDALVWYPSLAESGFGGARRVPKPANEEEGPAVVFADAAHSIFIADMSGDGLTDIVRIRNGEICYWPNLGYGRFGAKVTMDQAPWFDNPDRFDPKRIRLADIDGSGVTDIVYLAGDGVRLYFNQSGNAWGEAETLAAFPPLNNLANVEVLDLLGNGTACLVWSSSLPGDARHSMRYVDLMGGEKPHLLKRSQNNLGAENRVYYAPSTKFYLADRAAEQPWLTRLPFPVHVVERVETYDWISRNRFVTRYSYHHGYYDGIEREFRGFGMVEQRDTEELGALSQNGGFPDTTNIDAASYVPPVLTKTWFHTGAYFEGGRITRHFEEEYYREGGLTDQQLEAMLIPDTVFPADIELPDPGQPAIKLGDAGSPASSRPPSKPSRLPWDFSGDELREACRALKGSILRQEVYGLDASEAEDRPYSVSERDYTIECLQPLGGNRHAVFFTHARETVDFHYERRLYPVSGGELRDPAAAPADAVLAADPRVSHSAILAVNAYGNVLQSVAIGYGRRFRDPAITAEDQAKQQATLITFTENRYTDPILLDDAYRPPLPCESHTYELIKVVPDRTVPDVTNLLRFEELAGTPQKPGIVALAGDGKHDRPYEDLYDVGATEDHPYRRLIAATRTLYRPDDLGAVTKDPLPLGSAASLALPSESYKLAFTPGLLAEVYQRGQTALLPDPRGVLGSNGPDGGGYVDLDGDGHWWMPSGRIFYDPAPNATPEQELAQARSNFFLPRRFANAFGQSGTVDYDAHDLLLAKTADAKNNTVTAQNDYRVLQPETLTDPNGNQSQLAFDTLGLVVGTAVMGKAINPKANPPTKQEGDSLANFAADLTPQQIADFVSAADPHSPASGLLGGATTRIVYDLDRFRSTRDTNPSDLTKWQPVFAATLARETHLSDPVPSDGLKIQISFSHSDGFSREIQKKVQAEPGPLTPGGAVANPRWVGSGWTIVNNKGKPVRQYEPFFSGTHGFEFANIVGVSPILFYDPAERVVGTIHADHSWEKVVFDPWRQVSSDVNDTVTFNPTTDPDLSVYFSRLPNTDYLPTWNTLRTDPALAALATQRWPDPMLRAAEAEAAVKAAAHANTPTTAYFDTLGRSFLSFADNGAAGKYATRTELDIGGKQRAVIDATGRIVMRYDYDMLGKQIHQSSMEAGERWVLNDVAGKPIRSWDSRGHDFRSEYDELRRPTQQFARGTDAARSDPRTLGAEVLFSMTEYGEGQPDDAALNLRTRVFRKYDSAGVVTHLDQIPGTPQNEAYDFKGNLLRSARQLVQDYKGLADWSGKPALEPEIFHSATTCDALNRPVTLSAPDNSVVHPGYNMANLLTRMDVQLRGSAVSAAFVAGIEYNAKGQRELIKYGNGAATSYEYDSQTFRLIRVNTTRPTGSNGLASQLFKDPATVQDLQYTYDPAGNITRITDDALPVQFFANQQVAPISLYTYDPLYHLIQAHGREHIGQSALQLSLPQITYRDYPFAGLGAQPFDPKAVRNYTEQYNYDEVGNFQHLLHQAQNGAWTRDYAYNESSLIEPGKVNNRLSQTTISARTEKYAHDCDGNMTAMPHLPLMQWDFLGRLRATSRQVVNANPPPATAPEITYYLYDGSGQRTRKVTERQTGTRKNERIYLGGYEVWREYDGAGSAITLERETLHAMDDKQRVALVETRTQGDDGSPVQLARYQIGNHLGSASIELDGTAQLISYEEYYAYGTTSYQAGRSAAETSLKRYRYTGQERDGETGLAYHGARYYAPGLGRWTAADPVEPVEGSNLYWYASGNPIRLSDASGTSDADPNMTSEDPSLNLCRNDTTCEVPDKVPATINVATAQRIPPATEPDSKTNTANFDPNIGPTMQNLYAGYHEAAMKRSEWENFTHPVSDEEIAANDWHWKNTHKEPSTADNLALGVIYLSTWLQGGGFDYFTTPNLPSPTAAGTAANAEAAEALPAVQNSTTRLLGESEESLNSAIVEESRAAWGQLTKDNPSAGRIFEAGENLEGANEVNIIQHGFRGPESKMAGAGADTIHFPELGNLGPNTTAELLQQSGFTGGSVRLLACRTGVPNAQGITFGEQLSVALNSRGIPSTVAAPRGPVQIGWQFGPEPVVAPAQTPALTDPNRKTLIGIFAFQYW
jgi:RHS repeat-associated protein